MPQKQSSSGFHHAASWCHSIHFSLEAVCSSPASVRYRGHTRPFSFVSHVRLTGVSFYQIRAWTIRYSLTTDSCHYTDRLEARLLQRASWRRSRNPPWENRVCSVRKKGCFTTLGRSHITDAMKDPLARHSGGFFYCAFSHSGPPWFCPALLGEMLHSCHGRSASAANRLVPKNWTKTISRKAFAISCPLAWNRLPDYDDSLSLMEFRRKLKTFLF